MLDSRRVAAGAIGVVTVLALVFLIGRSPGGREQRAADGTTTTLPTTTNDRPASAGDGLGESADTVVVDSTVPAVGDGVSALDGPPPPADLDVAKAVATDFAVGFSSYRYDEPETAPLDRVRHLITDEVATVLGTNSGSSAERERQQERREVTEATLDAVVTGGYDADHAIFTVVVAQETRSTEATIGHLLAYQVALTRSADGWVITGVTTA
ncbi:MAG: hypothetical protein ACRD29_18905 [Acidimicrobiales bacterium]